MDTLGPGFICFIILMALNTFKVIDWSIWWILSPMAIEVVIIFLWGVGRVVKERWIR